jgi:hypothetical protein
MNVSEAKKGREAAGLGRPTFELIRLRKRAKLAVASAKKVGQQIHRCGLPVTLDNGSEFHGYAQRERKHGTKFYFARPYHSWERGLPAIRRSTRTRIFARPTLSEAALCQLAMAEIFT